MGSRGTAEEVNEIRRAFELGGGKISTRFSKPQLPQIIVCGSAGDPTYKEVKKQPGGSDVPAVTKQWVEECIKAKGQVSYTNFQLKPLTGLVISVTNFNHGERVNLQRLIQQGGGCYSAELYKERATHLICKTATGAKYQAVGLWGTLFAVNDQWVPASIKLGYPAPEEKYPPPAGQPKTAPAVKPAAAAAAAAAGPRPNPPVLQSIQGGMNSNDSWVAASSGGPPVAPLSSKQQQPQQQQQQRPTAEPEQQQQPVAASATAGGRTTRASARVQTASTADDTAAASTGQDDTSAAAAAHDRRQDGIKQQASAAATVPAAAAAAAEQIDPGLELAAKFAPLYAECLDFLERVQLWWCGMTPVQEAETRHMLFAFGGVWMPKLNQHTTHVMIGSQAQSSELLEVKQYLQSCNRKLNIVSPAWIQYCVSERQLVTDNRGRMRLEALLSHVAAGSASAAAGELGAGSAAVAGGAGSLPSSAAAMGTGNILGGVFAQSASRQGFPDAVAQEQQQQPGWVPEYWLHRPRDPTRLFEGCHFTIAALKGRMQEHEAALDKIRTYGGQLFNHGSTKPPASCPTVFAVCPSNLPPADEQQLMANDSSFRAVHSSCRVTLDWLDACVKRSELIRISTCHTPLFAPIRHSLPLAGFDKVSVVVSGYGDADQRKTILRLAELLGAKILGKLDKSAIPTHLIIPRWGPEAPGAPPAPPADELKELQIRKIRFAQKYRVQMVDSFWLVECLSEGRRVTEEYSRPKGVLELLPAAVGGTQAGVASQLPQTQIGGVSTQAPSAAPLGTKCLLPSHRPASSTAADVAGTSTPAATGDAGNGAATAPSRQSSWISRGTVGITQQKQQQQQQQQQQYDQQRPQFQDQQQRVQVQDDQQQLQQPPQPAVAQQRIGDDAPHPRRSLRKLLESPGKVDSVVAAVDYQQQQQQLLQQDHDQQQQQDQQATVSAVLRPAGDVALADVGNTLPSSPPAAPATAEIGAGTAGATTTGVQPSAPSTAVAAKPAAAPGGSDGDEDPALANIMANINALGKMAGRHEITDGSYASQSVPEMPSLQELTCKMGSGGAAAAGGSGGNAGGSGYSLRGKRKNAGGSLGSGGGKGSGSGGDGESGGLEGVDDDATAAVPGPAGAAKRPRRSSGAAAAMPPPPSRSAGKTAAGSGGRGGGGSRYCPKKGGAAAIPESLQMSQQVDYDVGQQPEALLAAAGRRRSQSAASDEKAKTAMLARVGLLSRKHA